ncbi:MAG: spiro-SPASM protein, partial [Treponema sp.]|nr:spiro-SPASM protein [Treponema sp.]
SKLTSLAEEFSEQAVVGLGTFADPLLNPEFGKYAEDVLSHEGLSLLIETDALNVLEEGVMQQIKKIAEKSPSRVTWIVSMDAFSPEVYNSIHGTRAEESAFAKATKAVQVLSQLFPGNVWPQFTRMNANECELESFYRYWHDKASPSCGNVIIQKFDHACLFFNDERPADLSPLLRNPCWHIKRDMTVLGNGDVPLCRENEPFAGDAVIVGNVLSEGIEAVWNKFKPYVNEHIEKKYCGKCGKCDEYYTFNF